MDNVNLKVIYGAIEIDPYKLPPLISISGSVKDIKQAIGFISNKKECKWLAACIILGQPFNRRQALELEKGG